MHTVPSIGLSRLVMSTCFDRRTENVLKGYGAPYEVRPITAAEKGTLNMTKVPATSSALDLPHER